MLSSFIKHSYKKAVFVTSNLKTKYCFSWWALGSFTEKQKLNSISQEETLP